ncbi:MAG TPA: hypothetical protein VNN16_06020, partial [Candidatus Sulfotelmatobacter sp.]|nr:hypothetical protein [Candidatus Sulfotelmatobacter sp.]
VAPTGTSCESARQFAPPAEHQKVNASEQPRYMEKHEPAKIDIHCPSFDWPDFPTRQQRKRGQSPYRCGNRWRVRIVEPTGEPDRKAEPGKKDESYEPVRIVIHRSFAARARERIPHDSISATAASA